MAEMYLWVFQLGAALSMVSEENLDSSPWKYSDVLESFHYYTVSREALDNSAYLYWAYF